MSEGFKTGNIRDFFRHRNLLIATMHGKEKAIGGLFEKHLGVKVIVPQNFDTDRFGTFSGEIERSSDPLTTAKRKCLSAMREFGCDLAIASEGSFGPHPELCFLNADDELLYFFDNHHGLEITVREISFHTNFRGRVIRTQDELYAFAELAMFPSHALILRDSAGGTGVIYKGINEWKTLLECYGEIFSLHGQVYLETDMRAMYNPTRMEVIRQASKKLFKKILNQCPACSMPGFDIRNSIKGLPCGLCGCPTNSVLSHTYSCVKCNYSIEDHFPNKKQKEDPLYCQICNP